MREANKSMKRCSKCKQIKSNDEFYKDNARNDGLFSRCKSCQNKHYKKYYKEYYDRPEVKEKISKKRKEYLARPGVKEHRAKQNKEYRNRPDIKEKIKKKRKKYNNCPKIKEQQLNYNLQQKYGITIDDKQAMIDKQNGLCAICKRKLNGNQEAFVDHNHKTDEVRGILCGNCNFILGHAKDSIDILYKAISYLKKYR